MYGLIPAHPVPPLPIPLSLDAYGGDTVADLAVVVYRNDERYIVACLESLYGGGLRCHFDVLAVDNGSSADDREALHARFPRLRTLRKEVNAEPASARQPGENALTAALCAP